MSSILISLISLALVAVIYTFIEARMLRINRQSIVSDKLPDEFNDFSIAFISDIHNYSSSGKRIKKIVKKINDLKPDLVLIGGDFNCDSAPDKEVCFKELSEIKIPCFAVLGNHDYHHSEDAIALMKKYDIGNINNRSFWITRGSSRIKIGGMDDYWHGYPYPESFLHDLSENDFSVLVCHNPDYFEIFDMSFVSLGLAGHHHGGQCSFFGLWAPMIRSEFSMKYTGSFVHRSGAHIVCSNGIGTSHIPVRFCAIPEINYITLKTNGD